MNEILEFYARHGGAVLFVVVLLEQTGLPIPAAPCLLAAGALYAKGQESPAASAAIGLTILACLLVDASWFWMGRRNGRRVLNFLCRVTLPAPHDQRLEQLERIFRIHAMPVLLLAKFLPGFSVLAPPLAGAVGIGAKRFFFFDALGAALYAGVYILLGAIFSHQLQGLLDLLHDFGIGSLVVAGGLIVAYLLFRHYPWRRSQQPAGPPATGREECA